jgi:hypothetical protein
MQLKVSELPQRIVDPEYLPVMSPVVKKSCQKFVNIATDIIHNNGMKVEEFNYLQEKLKNSMFFKYQVRKELDKIQAYNSQQ